MVKWLIGYDTFSSNVAYHGDLQKKAAMEQKRTLTGENGDTGPVAGKIEAFFFNMFISSIWYKFLVCNATPAICCSSQIIIITIYFHGQYYNCIAKTKIIKNDKDNNKVT